MAMWTDIAARASIVAWLNHCENRNIVVDDKRLGSGVERLQAEVALTHLERALAIVDSIELPLVIGARIQHAIDTLLPWTSRGVDNCH